MTKNRLAVMHVQQVQVPKNLVRKVKSFISKGRTIPDLASLLWYRQHTQPGRAGDMVVALSLAGCTVAEIDAALHLYTESAFYPNVRIQDLFEPVTVVQ